MTVPDESNPRWNAVLEGRGIEAVRNLLARSPGAGANSVVPGLGETSGERPTRIYAENWVARKVEAQEARQERRARNTMIIAVIGAVAAVAAVAVSFIAWRFPVK